MAFQNLTSLHKKITFMKVKQKSLYGTANIHYCLFGQKCDHLLLPIGVNDVLTMFEYSGMNNFLYTDGLSIANLFQAKSLGTK